VQRLPSLTLCRILQPWSVHTGCSPATNCTVLFIFSFYCASSYASTVFLVLILFLSVLHPSVTRVLCDKTKQWTADILIPHERAFTLVFWHQQWLVGDGPFCLKFALKVTQASKVAQFTDWSHTTLSQNMFSLIHLACNWHTSQTMVSPVVTRPTFEPTAGHVSLQTAGQLHGRSTEVQHACVVKHAAILQASRQVQQVQGGARWIGHSCRSCVWRKPTLGQNDKVGHQCLCPRCGYFLSLWQLF